MRRCTEGQKRIPKVRLDYCPTTITCSKECSRARQRRHRMADATRSTQKWRERERAAREKEKKGVPGTPTHTE